MIQWIRLIESCAEAMCAPTCAVFGRSSLGGVSLSCEVRHDDTSGFKAWNSPGTSGSRGRFSLPFVAALLAGLIVVVGCSKPGSSPVAGAGGASTDPHEQGGDEGDAGTTLSGAEARSADSNRAASDDHAAGDADSVEDPSESRADEPGRKVDGNGGAAKTPNGADNATSATNAKPPNDNGDKPSTANGEKPLSTNGGEIAHSAEREPDETLFEDWPEVAVALFITGRQDGYIEPCGCTGLANQKGGLARRFTFLRQLNEDRGWPVVAIDAGNQVRRYGVQPVLKFQRTVDALKQMNYDAVAFGKDDLRLPAGELFASVADETGDGSTPYLAANVAVLDVSFTPRYRIVEAGGRKIGITAVLGDEHVKSVQSDEIPVSSVDDGLKEVWPKLDEAKCDLYVLIAHASLDESAEIARRHSQFDLVITAGGVGEPTRDMETVLDLPEGSHTKMVQVGTKGMYVGVVGIFKDKDEPPRYQRVALSDRFGDAPEMRQLMKGYQDQLQAMGLEGLEVRPLDHPTGRKFVGSLQCGVCHTEAYAKWEETPHAHATDSLVNPGERSDISRHFDPECLSCHVTGWNAQKYYPYASGYLGLETTPRLMNSGCENCHGPGSSHVAAETGDEDVDMEQLLTRRKEMVLTLKDAEQKCIECHDHDNSPAFHDEGAFEKYWKQVEHYGKE